MQMQLKAGIGFAVLAATLTAGIFVGEALAYQPYMRAALNDLHAARAQLDRAEHNKGGHRVEAIRLTDAAIHEVELGMDDARY